MSRRNALIASRSDRPSRACSTITVATTWVGTDGWLRPWTTRSATAQVETAHGGGWRGRRTPTRQGPDDDTRPPRPTGHRLAGLQGSWRGVWLPGSPSATTGSTPPTGSTQPRPISRLLGGGRDVVEAVDPDAVGWDLVVAVEVGELPALDEDLVVLVEVEAEQWALELVEDWLAIAAHPDMGQALVELVEGIGDGLVDTGGVAREPSDIDDGNFSTIPTSSRSLPSLHP